MSVGDNVDLSNFHAVGSSPTDRIYYSLLPDITQFSVFVV